MALRTQTDDLHAVTAVLAAVAPSFDALAQLAPDWDSYGANSITPESIETAKQLVREVAATYPWLPTDDATPFVVPMADGGVQAEWDGPHGHLDVEVGGGQGFSYLLLLRDGTDERYEERHEVSLEMVVRAAGRLFGAA